MTFKGVGKEELLFFLAYNLGGHARGPLITACTHDNRRYEAHGRFKLKLSTVLVFVELDLI